jgi:hypothetical protein
MFGALLPPALVAHQPIPRCPATGILSTFHYRPNRHPEPSYCTNTFFHPAARHFHFHLNLNFHFHPRSFIRASNSRAFHLPDHVLVDSIATWPPSIQLNQTGVELFRMILLGQQSRVAAAALTLRSFLRKQSWQLCHRQFSSSLFLRDLYSCGEAKK